MFALPQGELGEGLAPDVSKLKLEIIGEESNAKRLSQDEEEARLAVGRGNFRPVDLERERLRSECNVLCRGRLDSGVCMSDIGCAFVGNRLRSFTLQHTETDSSTSTALQCMA